MSTKKLDFEDFLSNLKDVIKQGKDRALALSNEMVELERKIKKDKDLTDRSLYSAIPDVIHAIVTDLLGVDDLDIDRVNVYEDSLLVEYECPLQNKYLWRRFYYEKDILPELRRRNLV